MDRRITLVLEEKENHDQAVKRFRSLCDMHRIPFGGAGNLREFITALRQDRHFAMDFWAMVGSLSARERGTLNDDEMLDMLVEGSSGRKIAELPLTEKIVTAELKNMLAGVDTDSPLLPDVITEPEDDILAEERPEVLGVEENAPRAEKVRPVPTPRAAEGARTKISIEEALKRLEETSRELRDQLTAMDRLKHEEAPSEPPNSIKEEISGTEKITPEPAPSPKVPPPQRKSVFASDSPARYAARTEPAPAAPAEPVIAPRIAPRFVEEREIFASSQYSTLSHRGFSPRDGDDDPSISVPLADYAESNPRRVGVGTILLVILLLALAASWYALHKGYGRDQVARAKAAFLTKVGLFGEEIHDLASPSSPSENKPQPAATPDQQTTVLKPSQASDNRGAAPQQTATRPTVSPAPQPSNAAVSRPDSGARAARSQPSLVEPDAVRVPAAVMEANLISSRVPVYPDAARAMEIEGTVVVEAVISRTGAVDYARAISGDSHLRAAAEEAVMKWRYKPYLLNGVPVEAATQVRVTFRLP